MNRLFFSHVNNTGMCTQKGVFVDISRKRVPEKAVLGTCGEWQGLMDSNHRMTESESVALPLGEAPIMAGVDGIKPPSADLESAVLSLN